MQREVKYIDRGVEHVGTYRVEGWMLELTCAYGTHRVALGLFEPRALARKLLRVLVIKAQRAVVEAVPHPAAIEAVQAGVPPGVRRPASRLVCASVEAIRGVAASGVACEPSGEGWSDHAAKAARSTSAT